MKVSTALSCYAAVALLSALLSSATIGNAEGNLAAKPVRLEPLVLGADLSFSVKEYVLETGKYYRWQIQSQGGEEFLVQAPELFRNSWVNQVVIGDTEVKPVGGGLYGVEFDDEGTADVWFVPIVPGDFEFYAAGFRERGMLGKFVVR